MNTRSQLLKDFENAQNNLNAIEAFDCSGTMSRDRYSRLLAAAVRQSDVALDALFAGTPA